MDRCRPAGQGARSTLLVASVLVASACGDDSDVTSEASGGVEILTTVSDGNATTMDALSTFTLRYDSELNCLYHDEPDNNGEPGTGGRVAIVWPAGFTAVAEQGGASVLDATGTAVARTDVAFQIGGGAGPADTDYCDVISVWIASGPPPTPPADE